MKPQRAISPDERALLDQLLAEPFPGRDAIVRQLGTARVSDTQDADTRTLVFDVDASCPPAVTVGRVPVEASAIDLDGVPITILLHAVDGRAQELEIYRVDGQEIQHVGVPVARTVTIND
jgi:hypothetical protein